MVTKERQNSTMWWCFWLSIFMKTFGYKYNYLKRTCFFEFGTIEIQCAVHVFSQSFLSHQYQTKPKLWHQVLQVPRVIWFSLKITKLNKFLFLALPLNITTSTISSQYKQRKQMIFGLFAGRRRTCWSGRARNSAKVPFKSKWGELGFGCKS